MESNFSRSQKKIHGANSIKLSSTADPVLTDPWSSALALHSFYHKRNHTGRAVGCIYVYIIIICWACVSKVPQYGNYRTIHPGLYEQPLSFIMIYKIQLKEEAHKSAWKGRRMFEWDTISPWGPIKKQIRVTYKSVVEPLPTIDYVGTLLSFCCPLPLPWYTYRNMSIPIHWPYHSSSPKISLSKAFSGNNLGDRLPIRELSNIHLTGQSSGGLRYKAG